MKHQEQHNIQEQILKSQPVYRKINKDDIVYNYNKIIEDINNVKAKNNISRDINFMAVTKTVAPEYVNTAIECGIKLLGENRVQEFNSKKDDYIKSAEVHLIGKLQTNKVKYIINDVTMIQSLDSLKLAKEINRLAAKNNKVMDVLIEVNIGDEESKSGINYNQTEDFLESLLQFKNIHVRGFMAIPPRNSSEEIYYKMHKLFVDISDKKIDNINMDFLSIGMSGDYKTAIKHGSNLVRIGTGLFGSRK